MDREMGRIGYRPIPAKELLMEIKNLSELMVNLSYCSIFFGDKEILKEIHGIEDRIDELKSILIMQASLATRDKWDAEKLVSILDYLIGVDKVSDAAGDIALLAEHGLFLDIGSRELFMSTSTSLVYSLEVRKGSPLLGLKISDVYRMMNEVFDVIAVRRGRKYILSPKTDLELREGDVVFVNGLAENIRALIEWSGGRIEGKGFKGVEEGIIDYLVNLKELSEFMLDLAYSVLLTHSRELAHELVNIEENIDRLTHEFKLMVMDSRGLTPSEKLCLLEIANACERIGDAAMDITFSTRSGIEPHPIIEDALEESDERLALIKVNREMEGKNIDELGLDRIGVEILAMKKDGEWLIMPPSTGLKLEEGDILLVRYYSEAEDRLSKIVSIGETEELIRDIKESEKE